MILRRVLEELRFIAQSRHGLTIRELRARLAESDRDLRFTEETVRRDCATFERLGLVEPRPETDKGTRAPPWRLKLSQYFYSIFGIHRVQ